MSTLGTAAIASFAVASNLVTLQYLPGNALGLGLITIVGQCVGAGEYEQAKEYTKNSFGKLWIVGCYMWDNGFFSHSIVGIYHLSEEASEMYPSIIVSLLI